MIVLIVWAAALTVLLPGLATAGYLINHERGDRASGERSFRPVQPRQPQAQAAVAHHELPLGTSIRDGQTRCRDLDNLAGGRSPESGSLTSRTAGETPASVTAGRATTDLPGPKPPLAAGPAPRGAVQARKSPEGRAGEPHLPVSVREEVPAAPVHQPHARAQARPDTPADTSFDMPRWLLRLLFCDPGQVADELARDRERFAAKGMAA